MLPDPPVDLVQAIHVTRNVYMQQVPEETNKAVADLEATVAALLQSQVGKAA